MFVCCLQVDQAPELLRPSKCLGSRKRTDDTDVTDWQPICDAAKQRAAEGNCTAAGDKITREKPLLKCSYRSLSNFYQMQQHVRNHGAIVSRIIINVSCKDSMLDPLQCSAVGSWYAWPWACTAAFAVAGQ
jgi:hypothetical protein